VEPELAPTRSYVAASSKLGTGPNTGPTNANKGLHDTMTVSWNTELLEQYFLPMDIEIIKAIPLSTRRMGDRWAWHYEKNGMLTIQMMYRLLVHTKKRQEDWLEGRAASSNSARECNAWKRLLSIQVPAKVHVFRWRLA
jgi:hypothetical protein